VAIALLTTYLAGYRLELYERLAAEHGVEVLCYGGGDRYIPAWFTDLDRQLATAPFPARRLSGAREALAVGRGLRGGDRGPTRAARSFPPPISALAANRRPFVLWASVWAQPRSLSHALALR